MNLCWIVLLLLVSPYTVIANQTFHQIVEYVNSQGTTWTAGHNFDPDIYKPDNLKYLCGAKLQNSDVRPKKKHHDIGSLPLLFDGREHWINCPSIGQVVDQGACRSSWAISAVQTMNDRLCIFSEGRVITQVSAQDLLACCGELCGFGCEAGFPLEAWKYWKYTGIVTGSTYGDEKYCQPYSFPPCEHHIQGDLFKGKLQPCNVTKATPECFRTCKGNTSLEYNNDKSYAVEAYEVDSEVSQIQWEIYKNGPVQATMSVYADFFAYKGGVYKHVTGELIGGHAVRIIGWGQMDGTRYWTVANTWNREWGDGGYFLIKRGNNACGIEESIVAGRPRINDLVMDRSKDTIDAF